MELPIDKKFYDRMVGDQIKKIFAEEPDLDQAGFRVMTLAMSNLYVAGTILGRVAMPDNTDQLTENARRIFIDAFDASFDVVKQQQGKSSAKYLAADLLRRMMDKEDK